MPSAWHQHSPASSRHHYLLTSPSPSTDWGSPGAKLSPYLTVSSNAIQVDTRQASGWGGSLPTWDVCDLAAPSTVSTQMAGPEGVASPQHCVDGHSSLGWHTEFTRWQRLARNSPKPRYRIFRASCKRKTGLFLKSYLEFQDGNNRA